jgi:alcohol dehydrogenase class IV
MLRGNMATYSVVDSLAGSGEPAGPNQAGALAQAGGLGDSAAIFVGAFEFHYPRLAHVTYRAGAVADEPVRSLRHWGVARTVVVVSRSLASARLVKGLLQRLGDEGIDSWLFTGEMRHCPYAIAVDLARMVRDTGAQALVAIGGSSVSDTAKAANLLVTHAAGGEVPKLEDLGPLLTSDQAMALRMIAVPTTFSGGEFTPVVGISDSPRGRKVVLRHSGLCFDAIVLDPLLQRLTPHWLLASTGFKLLDHAVERLLARNHLPLIDVQCVNGLRLLLPRLERIADEEAAESGAARAELLQVLWVIQSSHGNVGTGLSHALSHQLGTLCGLDHGSGSAICLPATLKLLHQTGRIPSPRLDLLARAFGVASGASAFKLILGRLEALRRSLGLPASLFDAGVLSIDAGHLISMVLADPTVSTAPGVPLGQDELEELISWIAGEQAADGSAV